MTTQKRGPGRPKKAEKPIPKQKVTSIVAKKPKPKVGKPSTYNPHVHPKEAKALMAKGMIQRMCAYNLGISPSTLRNWQLKYPEFEAAIQEGASKADEKTVASLYKVANGFKGPDGKYYPPNERAIRYWLNNRDPNKWRDKQEIVADVRISDLSEEEIVDKIKQLIDDELSS